MDNLSNSIIPVARMIIKEKFYKHPTILPFKIFHRIITDREMLIHSEFEEFVKNSFENKELFEESIQKSYQAYGRL